MYNLLIGYYKKYELFGYPLTKFEIISISNRIIISLIYLVYYFFECMIMLLIMTYNLYILLVIALSKAILYLIFTSKLKSLEDLGCHCQWFISLIIINYEHFKNSISYIKVM